jgi:WD40 repeat protein
VTGSESGNVRLWDRDGRSRVLGRHGAGVGCVVECPDKAHVLSASADSTVRIWALGAGNGSRVFREQKSVVFRATFDPAGKRFATASYDGTLRIRELASGETLRTIEVGAPVYGVAFDGSGKRVASTSGGPQGEFSVRLWDAGSGEQLRAIPVSEGVPGFVVFSPDDRALVVAVGESVEVLPLTGDAEAFASRVPGGPTCFTFLADGRLAVGGRDGTLSLWDPALREPGLVFRAHDEAITSVAEAADHSLVTASQDGTMRVFDPRAIEETLALPPASLVDAERKASGLDVDGITVVEAARRGLVPVKK